MFFLMKLIAREKKQCLNDSISPANQWQLITALLVKLPGVKIQANSPQYTKYS